MHLIECQINTLPCPAEMQKQVMELTLENFQVLGITSDSISKSVMLGASIVLVPALFGFVVNVISRLINKA